MKAINIRENKRMKTKEINDTLVKRGTGKQRRKKRNMKNGRKLRKKTTNQC